MNIIVSNAQSTALNNLDIDIIKNINGTYDANELVAMFKALFFNKLILDVTALKNHENINSYQALSSGLDPNKVILLLPENTKMCTVAFLAKLVESGFYNFTTNIPGVKYLLTHSNSLKDVEQYRKMAATSSSPATPSPNQSVGTTTIIGVKDVTGGAGATTLIYMLKKQLTTIYGEQKVIAIEIDRNDFRAFGDKAMITVRRDEVRNVIRKYYNSVSIILVDLNDYDDLNICNEVFYLLEPSIIKINKLLRRDINALRKLKNHKLILNKSLLTGKDTSDFEYEANVKVYYNIPPLDERKSNGVINDFLAYVGLISSGNGRHENSNRVFGLFRR